jgi:hypothetical protein
LVEMHLFEWLRLRSAKASSAPADPALHLRTRRVEADVAPCYDSATFNSRPAPLPGRHRPVEQTADWKAMEPP